MLRTVPADNYREQILGTVCKNQVTILEGPTGSGKTTRSPLFLLGAGFAEMGRIGVTEPRVDAAITVAEYMAELNNTWLGNEIGYQVRHDDQTTRGTKVALMTEGILLRQMMQDPLLREYSVVMIDEAHERNLNTDYLLGLMKDLLKKRSDLHLVVASATIDTGRFSEYLNDAPIVSIEGRTYPVEIIYSDEFQGMAAEKAAALKTLQIIEYGEPGDIQIFLPGEREIYQAIENIKSLGINDVELLPLFAQLPQEERKKAYKDYDRRKIVVATNIAETSVTIDGMVHIVDPGLIKQSDFDPATGIGQLAVVKHSQAGCNQRAGRAGRTQSGYCHRLYSEEDFLARPKFTKPEIQRTSLAGVVLQMKEMGIKDVENFPFMDQPDPETFKAAHKHLVSLGALTPGNGLTESGRKMVRLPLEPHKARMVLEAEKNGCVREVAIIVAMTSTSKNPFYLPKKDKVEDVLQAKAAHARFQDGTSDHLMMLKLFEAWQDAGGMNASYTWYQENYIKKQAMEAAEKILCQLDELLYRDRIEMLSSDDNEKILKSVASGLVDFICIHEGKFRYLHTISNNDEVYIHPGSSLQSSLPHLLVTNEIVTTEGKNGERTYIRTASAIKPEWLVEMLPDSRMTVSESKIKYSDYTDTVIKEYNLTVDRHSVGAVKEPVSGSDARKAIARAFTTHHIFGKLRNSLTYQRARSVIEQYSITERVMRETVSLIASQIILEQLGDIETVEEAMELDIVLPEWLSNGARMVLESSRIFPNTVNLYGVDYPVRYEGVGVIEANIVGVPDGVAAIMTYADLPAMPVYQVKIYQNYLYNWTMESKKEILSAEGFRVVPAGKMPEYNWTPVAESESLSKSMIQNVVIGDRELPVSYNDMTMRAKIVIPEDMNESIKGDELPSVYPYQWQITATMNGHTFNPNGLSQIAGILRAVKLREQANEEIKSLEGTKSYDNVANELKQAQSSWELENVLRQIEDAKLREKQQVERVQKMEVSQRELSEYVDAFLGKCPFCSALLDETGCKCLQTLTDIQLGKVGINGQEEINLVELKTDKGTTVARIYYRRVKGGKRLILRDVLGITEPFEDLDVVERKI